MHKQNSPFLVTIVGASGFVGKNLVRHLLETTTFSVRAVCRHPETIEYDKKYKSRIELIAADIFDYDAILESLKTADAAVYLIHMMAVKGGDYYELETDAAEVFGRAAHALNLSRVVYMSGLGNDADILSHHLASRHHTGRILKSYVPLVIELRASMIIGEGSIAYDIMRNFVKLLPLQTMPSWAVTKTQPIGLSDALRYLTASLTVPITGNEVVDIGGPEQLTYKDLISKYAKFAGRRPILIVVPIVPMWLGAAWLNLFAPRRHARVGRQMAESLMNPMVMVNDRAAELFPEIKPEPIENAFC